MVHLIIKELAHSAEDIIMVTSTIMKDTGGGTDAIFRPNAIRALCRIIDVSIGNVPGELELTGIGIYCSKH
jgi:coatomer protein complex subunit gamma